MKGRKSLGALATGVVIVVLAYSASLLVAESVYSNRGSFAYWLTISRVIKNVPEISPADTPRFYSSAGDGPKLPESAVTYRTSAERDVVVLELNRYLTAKGYHRRPDGVYENGQSIVTIAVTPEASGSRVVVRENY